MLPSMRPNTSIVKSLRSTCSVYQVNRVTNVSGGCINEAKKYETDNGDYFIKQNSDKGSFEMFQAEFLGLQTILETNSIRAPKPLVVDRLGDDGAFIIMEYTDIARLTKEASVKLGEQLAAMHKYPATLFGFDVDNTIGSTPQINTNRTHDWVEFFTKWRLQYQLNLINEQYQDHDLHQLGMKLSKNIQQFFPPDLQVTPALLHGDLWSGNVGCNSETGEPIIFDPATYYGHSEAELSIMKMFGGFSDSFFNSYHSILPKHEEKFNERQQLYQLYHYLNHYNLFGSGYRGTCMNIIKSLL